MMNPAHTRKFWQSRMGIAAHLHGRPFGQTGVGLTQLEALPLGLPHQSLQGLQVQFGVGRMSDGLGLHRRVDTDPLQARRSHRAALQPSLDGGRKQRPQSLGSKPLAPARQRARITRRLMLEILAAAEPLPIGILDEALHHRLIGQVEGVLEIRQPDHQPGGFGRLSERAVEATKLLVEALPVDQTCQAKELMALIQDLIETAAVEIAGDRHRWLGSHAKHQV
jgi:hypothetical protein